MIERAKGGLTVDEKQVHVVARVLEKQPIPRRRLLGGLFGGAFTGVLAARSFNPAMAQVSTPTTEPVPAILQEWAAAWSEHDDGTRLAALYTGDGTHEEVPSGTVFSGPEAIAGYAQSHFTAFPDVKLELRSAFTTGDLAAAEWVYAGTYEGTLPGLPPGAGQPFSVRGAAIFELQDDKIQRSASYFDFYSLLVQLGVLPAPGAAATPTP
jgi:steroid delta-isomerase-like uncharacterized protein